MSTELFSKLIAAVQAIDLQGTGVRWIARHSDADADFLTLAEVQALRLGRRLGACRMTFADNTVIALAGIDPEADILFLGLTRIDPTPAYFQLAVQELGLRPTASESQIRDVIEQESGDYLGYRGHDFDQVSLLFEKISYWVPNDDIDYTKDLRRVLGYSICASRYETPLSHSDEIINEFELIFQEADQYFPFMLILQALMASFWQTQYIEIYRCIEQLFPAEKLFRLKSKLRSKRSLRVLNDIVMESLNWRPNEDIALYSLFETLSNENIESIRVALNLSNTEGDLRQLISNKVYKIRNAIVHYRGDKSREIIALNESDWAKLNLALLKVTNQLYARFGRTFF